MAKIDINFNNNKYTIDESSLSAASSALKSHLSSVMNGQGATINFDGVTYSIDSTKLTNATNAFVSHLGTISGSGHKVKVNGVEYSVGFDKVAGAVSEIDAVLGGLNNPSSDETLEGDGQEFHKFAPTALTFRSTAPLNELQEVQINGVTVDPSNYTLEEGSTIVTLPIEYLNTLDVDNYEITVVSDNKTAKGGFTVFEPELNEHEFYYNQPYVAYVEYFGGTVAFFIRENGTYDFINGDYIETGTYEIDRNNIMTHSSLGDIPATLVSSKEINCDAIGASFVCDNDTSITADEDYIYIYKEDLGGYEVTAIDKTQAEYRAIKTGINGIDTVKIAEDAFCKIKEGIWTGSSMTIAPDIPHTVKIIGDNAFYNCTALELINPPNELTTIGGGAFFGCESLTGMNLQDGLTTIGDNAFYNCTSLEWINIHDSITTIGSGAFFGCESLTGMNIPDGVTSIDASTFNSCTSLTGINIHDRVTSIGALAFANCTSCTQINFSGTIVQWNSITKDDTWNYNVPATYVQCSDGQVPLN